jgi:hypothetical protein
MRVRFAGIDYAIRRYLRASNGDIRREIAIGRCPGASAEYREFQKAEERSDIQRSFHRPIPDRTLSQVRFHSSNDFWQI